MTRQFLLANLEAKEQGGYRWRINLPALALSLPQLADFPDMAGKTFKGQTLFVRGERSDYVTDSDLPAIKRLFPNAEVVKIENAGHLVHFENREKFLSVSHAFLSH